MELITLPVLTLFVIYKWNKYMLNRLSPLHYIFSISLVISPSVFANTGLNKLNAFLSTLKGKDEITAEMTTFLSRYRDEEELKEGQVTVVLQDGVQGFNLTYRAGVMNKVAEEQQATYEQKKLAQQGVEITDPVDTPTMMAMRFLQPIEMHNALYKAQGMKKFISQLTYLSEGKDENSVNQLTVLSFSVDMETIVSDKKAREYVDDFDGNYRIWITNEGEPIKAELTYQGNGTAYLIFNLDVAHKLTESYEVVGDRLIAKTHSNETKNTHTFGSMHFNTQKQIKVIDHISKQRATTAPLKQPKT